MRNCIYFVIILYIMGCTGNDLSWTLDPLKPKIKTYPVLQFINNSIIVKGEVIHDGGSKIVKRGFCFGLSPGPVLGNGITTEVQGEVGVFESILTSLKENNKYYIRSFASNKEGTSYGEEVSFIVPVLPKVVTVKSENVTLNSGRLYGEIILGTASSLSEKGFYLSTNDNPGPGDPKLSHNSVNADAYFVDISGIKPSSTYYFRAFAVNKDGVAMGDVKSFTTLSANCLPVVSTSIAESITSNSVKFGGVISSDGGQAITEKGVVWSNTPSPTIQQSPKIASGTGTGSFAITLTSLSPDTRYYYKAYAINACGPSYGQEVSFFTNKCAPIANTKEATSISSNSAMSGGIVTSDSGFPITGRGVVWSTNPAPTINLTTKTNEGTGSGSFTSTLSNLNSDTKYYYKAYAINSCGTTYGQEYSLTTNNCFPSVSTIVATGVTSNSAVAGGNVTSSNGFPVSSRGIVWSTSPYPDISLSTKINSGSGTGIFSVTIPNLVPETNYYYRAFSSNACGTSYGVEYSFVTLKCSPTISTTPASSITSNSATSGGFISNSGGTAVSSRGVVWSTNPNPIITLNTKTLDGTGNGTFSSSITGLLPNKKYYYRAYATNNCSTSYGTESSFTTPNGLSAPILLAPLNNAVVQCCYFYLDWSCVQSATQYEVQISTNQNFTGTTYKLPCTPGGTLNATGVMKEIINPVCFNNEASTCQMGTGSSGSKGTYFWRVKAINGSVSSPWSNTWSFTYNF